MSKEKKQKRSDDFGKTLKRIIKLMFKKYMISSILVVLFALISTVFGIVGPKIMGQATTKLFEGLVAKINNTGGIDFEKNCRNLVNSTRIICIIFYVYVC